MLDPVLAEQPQQMLGGGRRPEVVHAVLLIQRLSSTRTEIKYLKRRRSIIASPPPRGGRAR
jgi:hypothetical protein